MRTIAFLLAILVWCSTGRAEFVTNVDPADYVTWLPVTIEPPADFDPVASARVRSIPIDPSDGSISDVLLPTAPYQFWLMRAANPHPNHATWWLDIGVQLNGSPIGGGLNTFMLERDEALANSLILRPKPEFYAPGTPPNNRVD